MVIDSPSPSSPISATFTGAKELRPETLPSKADGLLLCHLTIGAIAFPNRTFCPTGIWSSDSRYFATMEYRDYPAVSISLSVNSHLIVVDVPNRLECVVAKQSRGSVLPLAFEGDVLVFTRELDQAIGFRHIREIRFTEFRSWQPTAQTEGQ